MAGNHIGTQSDINDKIMESNIAFPDDCKDLTEGGFYGLTVRFDGRQKIVKLKPFEEETKVLCPVFDQSIVRDQHLLKKRIARIFEYILYFQEGDPKPDWPIKNVKCGKLLKSAPSFAQLPSYFSEGLRLYLNKKGENIPNKVIFQNDVSSDEDCDSLTMKTMRGLSSLSAALTDRARTKKYDLAENVKGNVTSLVRAKRSPIDLLYGSSSEAEIVRNININSQNIKMLYDWSMSFRSNLEEIFSSDRTLHEKMVDNATHLALEAQGADTELDLAVNMIFLQLHGIKKSMDLHTNLLSLERLEGNILRAASSLGKTVTGRSTCQLGYGAASCSKGKPTVTIQDSVLRISTIEEKVSLRKANKYSCVPVKGGLSIRNEATVIHGSTDGRLLLSNGHIVSTEPQPDEFEPVGEYKLPVIEGCFFNSDFSDNYLISCPSKTYITLKNNNVVLEEFQVLAFKGENFPLQMGHKKIKAEDVLDLINVFSGIRAAKQLTVHEDFSPIQFGHLVADLGKDNTTENRWEFNLPTLIYRHPAVLHYVSITAVFLVILAIILMLYILRLVVSNWGNIKEMFITLCSCRWFLRLVGYSNEENDDYLEVPTAPDRDTIDDENLRFNETMRNVDRLEGRPIFRPPRQPAFAPDLSLDSPQTDDARARQDRKAREVAKARRIVSRYGMDSVTGVAPPSRVSPVTGSAEARSLNN